MAQSHIALRALAVLQGEAIEAARRSDFFPLTPALSLGERVNPSLHGVQSRPAGFPPRDARCSLSLRERVRVRGNGANYSLGYPGIRPFPEVLKGTRPPAKQEVSQNDYDNAQTALSANTEH